MKKLLGKNDLILIGVLTAIFLVIVAALYMTRATGNQVVVSVDGKEVASFSLNKDRVYEIQGYDGGRNVLVIKDGAAYMSEASCPDHLCMFMGKVSSVGQSIICLPNRVVIEIRGDEEAQYDTVS